MVAKKNYKKRVVDSLLQDQLEAAGVVLIEGAKWCGKTTTAEQQAASVLYMNDPKTQTSNMRLAETDINVLLEGKTPRLIDEWQVAPQLWDAARFLVDHRSEEGQIIFTGSAEPADQSKMMHSGTGRVGWVKMRPMSLWESEDSNGKISLSDLFANNFHPVASKDTSLRELCYLVCRGGWPKAVGKSEKASLMQSFNYVDAIAKREMKEVENINRSEQNTRLLLRCCARHQAAPISVGTIAADFSQHENSKVSDETIRSYLNALRKLFVIEDLSAWNPNLRSKAAIRTSDTHYFVDPSIATAALGVGPDDLMKDLNTLGLLFETMAVRDLRVYTEALDGSVYHYRDNNGLECDAVLHLRNGHYGLVEVKLGGDTLIDEGAKNLQLLAKKIDTDRMYAPSFQMVLTGVGQYSYQRPDGVFVVPITVLKP